MGTDFLRAWIEDTVAPSMRSATVISYRSVVERRIVPTIGAVKVERLTSAVIQRFCTYLSDATVGDRTR